MMALESFTWALWIMWYSIKEQGFNHNPLVTRKNSSMIWPSDLVFVRDFTEANILTKFHEYRTEFVASRAYTR